MIPPLRQDGTLPPGIHEAESWDEIVQQFGNSLQRKKLLKKLRAGLDHLRGVGCPWVLLDGSFVTNKINPNDIDGCWEYVPSLDLTNLDPAFLLRTAKDRATLKTRYGMDFFMAGLIEAGSGQPFAEFFQTDRNGNSKGIIRLDLNAELTAS